MNRRAPAQSRNLGTMGEDAFRNWCSKVGLSAVSSQPDRMGWDFIVEFDDPPIAGVPRDRQNTSKKALIQIKSTDRKENAARAKLSALKRLVDTTLPSFILHLSFDGKNEPVRTRLLHIGEDQIEEVLGTVRAAESKGRTDFHNILKALPLSGANELKTDGSEILEELWEAIPADMAAYASEKSRHIKTCGFNEKSITAGFSIEGAAGEEALVDLMIGSSKSLAVSNFRVALSRFGFSLPADVREFGDAVISIENEGAPQAWLRVVTEEGLVNAELPAKLHVPQLPGIAEANRKLRIANDFVELLHRPGGDDTFSVKFDDQKQYTLMELEKALRFCVQATYPNARLQIDVGADKKITTKFPDEIRQLLSWSDLHEFAALISEAMIRHKGVVDCSLTFAELRTIYKDNRQMFWALKGSVSFSTSSRAPAKVPKAGVLLFPIAIAFKEWLFMGLTRSEARVSVLKDGTVHLRGGRPEILEQRLVDRSDAALDALNQRARAFAAMEKEEGIYVATCKVQRTQQSTIELG